MNRIVNGSKIERQLNGLYNAAVVFVARIRFYSLMKQKSVADRSGRDGVRLKASAWYTLFFDHVGSGRVKLSAHEM